MRCDCIKSNRRAFSPVEGVQERISVLCRLLVPIFVPLMAIHDGTESCHSVDSSDSPFCGGLFESASDEIFACSLDLAATDGSALLETFGIIHV